MINKLINENKLSVTGYRNYKESGFTLLELAIVILIGGILMSFMASALVAYMKQSRITKTHFRIEKVQESLAQYLDVNGRYPCAASRVLGPESTNFGHEVADCSAAATGTARNSGVRIGAVPTRTLNLPDDFIADAWGHKFTYAVTEDLANTATYQANGGKIFIRDAQGNTLVTPDPGPPSRDNTAHYVVLSHGETGDGSFPITAANSPSVPCPLAANALDDENCNDDNRFVSTLVNSDAVSTNFYDDYVSFKGQTVPVFFVPSGAVFAFNLATCPDGWTEYTPARGRFVIGAQSASKVMNDYDLQINASDPDVSLPINVGDSAPADAQTVVIPPYVALLYCQKT